MKIPPLRHDAGRESELPGERRLILEQSHQPVPGARVAVRVRVGAGGMFHGVGAGQCLDAAVILRQAAQQRGQVLHPLRHHMDDA